MTNCHVNTKFHPRSSGSWFFLNRFMKRCGSPNPKRPSAAAIASLVLLSLFVVCCSIAAVAAIGDPGGDFFPTKQSVGGGGIGADVARLAKVVILPNGALGLQLWHQFSFWLQFEHCGGDGAPAKADLGFVLVGLDGLQRRRGLG